MTIAVCLRCGEFKDGALTPCLKCHYTPADDDSMIKHLLITDKHLSREQLQTASAKVKEGKQLSLPFTVELLEASWDDPKAAERIGKWVIAWKQRVTVGGTVLLIILVIVALVWAVWQRL